MRQLRTFFRENPQVLVLLILCLVLGIGTFLVVVLGLITSGGGSNPGEPVGTVLRLAAANSLGLL